MTEQTDTNRHYFNGFLRRYFQLFSDTSRNK